MLWWAKCVEVCNFSPIWLFPLLFIFCRRHLSKSSRQNVECISKSNTPSCILAQEVTSDACALQPASSPISCSLLHRMDKDNRPRHECEESDWNCWRLHNTPETEEGWVFTSWHYSVQVELCLFSVPSWRARWRSVSTAASRGRGLVPLWSFRVLPCSAGSALLPLLLEELQSTLTVAAGVGTSESAGRRSLSQWKGTPSSTLRVWPRFL